MKFKGIDNINDIEKYKGKSLYVTREHAVKLKKDEYFIADLIDMQVELEDGTLFGVLNDVCRPERTMCTASRQKNTGKF